MTGPSMSNEMPDSTKELLTAHHAAVLRELDTVNRGIEAIGQRTNHLECKVGVLTWAYGVAAMAAGALAAKLGFGGQ